MCRRDDPRRRVAVHDVQTTGRGRRVATPEYYVKGDPNRDDRVRGVDDRRDAPDEAELALPFEGTSAIGAERPGPAAVRDLAAARGVARCINRLLHLRSVDVPESIRDRFDMWRAVISGFQREDP